MLTGGTVVIGIGIGYKRPEHERFNLVFDLDGTLITSKKIGKGKPQTIEPVMQHVGYNVWRRPHAQWTLSLLSKFTNLHMFTAATQDYADGIIDKALPTAKFKSRFYRPSCVDTRAYGKDLLRVVETDQLATSILIDDRKFNQQPGQNFYHIPAYEKPDNQRFDTQLVKLVAKTACAYVWDGALFGPNRESVGRSKEEGQTVTAK